MSGGGNALRVQPVIIQAQTIDPHSYIDLTPPQTGNSNRLPVVDIGKHIDFVDDCNVDDRTSFISADSSEDGALPTNDSLDSVTVVVRVRPLVDAETRRGDAHVAQNLGAGSILVRHSGIP